MSLSSICSIPVADLKLIAHQMPAYQLATAPWPANFSPKPSGRDEMSVCAWLLHQGNWDFTPWEDFIVAHDGDEVESFDELCVAIAYVADRTPTDLRNIFKKHSNELLETFRPLKLNHKSAPLPEETRCAILNDTRRSIFEDLERSQGHRFFLTIERWLRKAISLFLERDYVETLKERKAPKKAVRKITVSGPALSANTPEPKPSNTCAAAEPRADVLRKKGGLESVVHGQSAADATITASSHAKDSEKDEFGEMSMDDFKFLVTCLQHSKSGPISVSSRFPNSLPKRDNSYGDIVLSTVYEPQLDRYSSSINCPGIPANIRLEPDMHVKTAI